MALVCIVTGIILMVPLSKIFLKKDDDDSSSQRRRGKTLAQLVNEYQLSENLFRVNVRKGSRIVNERIGDLDLTNKYGIVIAEIRRESSSQPSILKTLNQQLA